jgi:hypothetical protein
MNVIDFSKELKGLYTAKRTVQEVLAGAGAFLAVEGQGKPGGDAFQQAFQQLFPVVYTLKFALREAKSLDFKVGKPECLYLSPPHETPIDQWQWRLLIRIPDEYSPQDVSAVKRAVREKKGLDVAAVKRVRWKEGRAVQVLHVGPYDEVAPAYEQLAAFAREQGLAVAGPAHEIYLNDPRRAAPEKLKTILRLAVKKA